MTKTLEQLFDTATSENSEALTRSHPSINSARVDAIQIIGGPAIAQLTTKRDAVSNTYEYYELDQSDIDFIKNLDFDPYNDAAYARALLERFIWT